MFAENNRTVEKVPMKPNQNLITWALLLCIFAHHASDALWKVYASFAILCAGTWAMQCLIAFDDWIERRHLKPVHELTLTEKIALASINYPDGTNDPDRTTCGTDAK